MTVQTSNQPRKTIGGSFELLQVLGKGSFAEVRAVKALSNSMTAPHHTDMFAAKIVTTKKVGGSTTHGEETCWRKVQGHPNIASLHHVFTTESQTIFIQELIQGRELFQHIVDAWELKGRSSVGLDERTCKKYFSELISAIHHMHSCGVSHRDIKPENILIDETNNSVKLIDFGFATMDRVSDSQCGTIDYIAPEVLTRRPFDPFAADVWACGVVLYAMLTSRLPFSADCNEDTRNNIRKGVIPFYATMSVQAWDLVSRILVVDPAKRISVAEILQHPFMSNSSRPESCR